MTEPTTTATAPKEDHPPVIDAEPATAPALATASPLSSARPRSSHRPLEQITLPSDAVEASALVVDFIRRGGTGYDRATAIEAANSRLESIKANDSDRAETELIAHSDILSALFQHYTARAVMAPNADHSAKFAKLAMQAQAGHARCLIAAAALAQQRKGKTLVLPDDGGDGED